MKGSSLRDWRDLNAWLARVEHLLKENDKVRRQVTWHVRAAVRKIKEQEA